MIDLTTINEFKHKWEVDENTGFLNIIFLVAGALPGDPDVELDRIVVEPSKARPLLDALDKIAKENFPDPDFEQHLDHKTEWDNRILTAETEFF